MNTGDDVADQTLDVDSPATIVAAIGPLNNKMEAAYHNIEVTGGRDEPIKIMFNRLENSRKCKSMSLSRSPERDYYTKANVWDQAIFKEETQFEVEIGPAGGDKGYTGITGIPSWGIALWVNKEVRLIEKPVVLIDN